MLYRSKMRIWTYFYLNYGETAGRSERSSLHPTGVSWRAETDIMIHLFITVLEQMARRIRQAA